MRHKWLNKIGINSYPDNNFGDYTFKGIIRDIKYKLKRHILGLDVRDCWNLDTLYYQWLYEHLKQYIEDADTIVNLEYFKFNYNGKEYTQLELTNLLCDKLEQMINWDEFEGIEDNDKYEFKIEEDGTRHLIDNRTEEEKEQFRAIYEQNNKAHNKLKDEIFELWKMVVDYTWW